MILRQLIANCFLFFISIFGLLFNPKNIIIILMCIELILLSLNLNFIIFSIYLDDIYGQIFSLFILTIAAAESAIGLAIIITCYRIRGTISPHEISLIRY